MKRRDRKIKEVISKLKNKLGDTKIKNISRPNKPKPDKKKPKDADTESKKKKKTPPPFFQNENRHLSFSVAVTAGFFQPDPADKYDHGCNRQKPVSLSHPPRSGPRPANCDLRGFRLRSSALP